MKLSKRGQRGEDSGETKKGIVWYRSEGERGRREVEERRTVPCGVLVGGLAVEEITALIGKKRLLSGCRVRGKNAACHSAALFSYSSLPLLLFSALSA